MSDMLKLTIKVETEKGEEKSFNVIVKSSTSGVFQRLVGQRFMPFMKESYVYTELAKQIPEVSYSSNNLSFCL
jgi:hypothetical protein